MAPENMQMERDGNTLKITIDLTKEIGPSASGKTTLLASPGWNIDVPNAEGVKVGLNVYKR
ncbi:MAG: hypothetical protein GYA24_04175 [Candidatus Lokiarchaeota archaeon]|nr:hypothetical protein [Candidatus Lokiarchaeota archaeon]